ncbi:MAG: 3-oxoacyl-[acyl-carrier-protein] synthase, partial [Cyanobacteriota bacterium]
MELKRVVVTGLGAVTPLGNNLQDYWKGLINGRSGIGPITLFDASKHVCQIGGEVKGFDPHDYLDRKEAKRIDRFAQFAIAASQQALTDAQFVINDLNAEEIGVIIGTGVGGLKVLEDQHEILMTKGATRCSPFMIPMMIANMAAGLTAIHTGARGP